VIHKPGDISFFNRLSLHKKISGIHMMLVVGAWLSIQLLAYFWFEIIGWLEWYDFYKGSAIAKLAVETLLFLCLVGYLLLANNRIDRTPSYFSLLGFGLLMVFINLYALLVRY
jgi:hypothetical protein